MKIKSFTKIISGILCAALTMQIGLGLKTEKINAYFGSITSEESSNGSEVHLSTSDGTTIGFDFTTDNDGGINISYQSDNAGTITTKHFDKISVLTLADQACQINIMSDISVNEINLYGGSLIIVKENHTLSCSKIISAGYPQILVENGATLECGQVLYGEGSGRLIFTNNGTMVFDSIAVADSVDFTRLEYYLAADATIKVTSSLFIGYVDEGSAGAFITEPTTIITSNGYSSYRNENYSFNLQVDGITKEITGAVDTTAERLIYENPEIELDDISDLYYGQEYDFNDLISVADGYDESLAYLEYSSDYSDFTTEKPTAQGSYYVRAVAPATDTYYGDTSAINHYSIDYLPFRDILPVGSKTYDSVSGIVNGKYVAGDLVLKMPDGVLIKGSSFDSGDFSNTNA